MYVLLFDVLLRNVIETWTHLKDLEFVLLFWLLLFWLLCKLSKLGSGITGWDGVSGGVWMFFFLFSLFLFELSLLVLFLLLLLVGLLVGLLVILGCTTSLNLQCAVIAFEAGEASIFAVVCCDNFKALSNEEERAFD